MAAGLLLLHGFTGAPASWEAVTRGLPAEIDTLAPFLVGHGPEAIANVRGFEGEVDRIAALAVSTRTWHLVGYSLGGRLALGLLVRHPALFASATLVGAQPGLETESARAERRAADERWCEMLERKSLADFVAAWQAQPLFASQAALPSGALERQRVERMSHSGAGLARSLRTTGLGVMPSYWDALSSIRVPTTLVVGAKDEKFSTIARRMIAGMPSARLETAAGSGHNVVLENPEVIRAAIGRAFGQGGA